MELPPEPLAERVRARRPGPYPTEYLASGRIARDAIERVLPAGWDWHDKRVLDFGCGAGRVLRHFTDVAAAFHGCDIDRPSIDWLGEHSSFAVAVCDEHPPLPYPDGSFDLVYAISVFTHITDEWADWLLEMRRILKPGGLLLATFMGEGVWHLTGFPDAWDAERVGMLAYLLTRPWDKGGPNVLHSQWWVEEHWGRAFQVIDIAPKGFFGDVGTTDVHDHGFVLARRDDRECDEGELARIDGSDAREVAALRYQVSIFEREVRQVAARTPTGREGLAALLDAIHRRIPTRRFVDRVRGRDGA